MRSQGSSDRLCQRERAEIDVAAPPTLAVKADDIVDQGYIGGQQAHNTIPPAACRRLRRQDGRGAAETADLDAKRITKLLLCARQAGNRQRVQRLLQAP